MSCRPPIYPYIILAPQNTVTTPVTITVSTTQPTDPNDGDIWIDTT